MFAPGDEVVCVDAGGRPGPGMWDAVLVSGAHYVVRWSGHYRNSSGDAYSGVRLVGIDRSALGCLDTPFCADRFRPVRRESIEIFRAMCVSTKPLVEV